MCCDYPFFKEGHLNKQKKTMPGDGGKEGKLLLTKKKKIKRRKSKRIMAIVLAGILPIGLINVGRTDADAATKVMLSKSQITIQVGHRTSLKLKNVKKKDIKKICWSSSDKKVAKVSPAKNATKTTVKAVGAGVSTIKAKIGGKKYTCKVTVTLKEATSNEELYDAAVRDAVFIEDDEILPLVNISRDDENVLWDDKGRVLVAFMHKYPDSYPAGEDIELKWGNVWCVSAKEMYKWVQNNGDGVTDWTTRLHQVLGMPTSKGYNTITALWVDAKLLYRPANVSDPSAEMEAKYKPTGDEAFDKKFKEFFDGNIVWSYFDSAYPWTRLGYTYDWADNGTEYGMSEFLIFEGAKATVEYTYNVGDLVTFACKAGNGGMES